MAGFQGNLKIKQADKRATSLLSSYERALLYRFLSLFPIGEIVFQLITGRGYLLVPPARAGIQLSLHDNPLLFYFGMLVYLYAVAALWFVLPYQQWVFTLKLPPKPPEPVDDWKPTKKFVLPKPSDFIEPVFLKSILVLICFLGLMATLFGALQAVTGEIYAPVGHDLEIYTLDDDPLGFAKALIPYGVIGLVTLILGTIAYLWQPDISPSSNQTAGMT